MIKSHLKIQPRGGGRGAQESTPRFSREEVGEVLKSQLHRFSREEVGKVIKSHLKIQIKSHLKIQPRGGGRGDQKSSKNSDQESSKNSAERRWERCSRVYSQIQPRGGGRGAQESTPRFSREEVGDVLKSQLHRFSREEVGEVIKSHLKIQFKSHLKIQPRGGGRGAQEPTTQIQPRGGGRGAQEPTTQIQPRGGGRGDQKSSKNSDQEEVKNCLRGITTQKKTKKTNPLSHPHNQYCATKKSHESGSRSPLSPLLSFIMSYELILHRRIESPTTVDAWK